MRGGRTVEVTHQTDGRGEVVSVAARDWFGSLNLMSSDMSTCDVCGAAVSDEATHLQWHVFTVKDIQWEDLSYGG